jgi:hypothetical protein
MPTAARRKFRFVPQREVATNAAGCRYPGVEVHQNSYSLADIPVSIWIAECIGDLY